MIEHIPDPRPLLACLFTLLKPGGQLFMHTPNVTVQLPKARLKKLFKGMRPGVHYLEAKDHLHLYSTKTMPALLKPYGFSAIRFIHLRPIQSVAGSRRRLGILGKNGWFALARGLAVLSGGAINFDNLFVVARK